jgi:aminoethylphosphonate catabolism LysR family transcriptional regulator
MPMVKALLQQEADIEFFLRNSGQGTGTLRIAATAPYYILDLVKAFRERLPQIEVSVDIGNSQQVLEALEEYRVDIAVSSQLLEDPRLIRRVLGSDPLVLAVHRNHPLAALEHVPLSALAGHCLLMREQGSTTRRLTEDLLATAGVGFGPLLEIGSRESIREAVLRNIGISIIARQEVPHDPAVAGADAGKRARDSRIPVLPQGAKARLAAFLGAGKPAFLGFWQMQEMWEGCCASGRKVLLPKSTNTTIGSFCLAATSCTHCLSRMTLICLMRCIHEPLQRNRFVPTRRADAGAQCEQTLRRLHRAG